MVKDVEKKIKADTGKDIPPRLIINQIFTMKKKGIVDVVRASKGPEPAIYEEEIYRWERARKLARLNRHSTLAFARNNAPLSHTKLKPDCPAVLEAPQEEKRIQKPEGYQTEF